MRYLRHTLTWGWGLSAALVIVLALIVSVSRLVLPHADRYRPEVEQQLSKLLQRPVTIGRLQAEWNSLYPVLHVHDVQLAALDDGTGAFSFQELRVALNPLLLWQPGEMQPSSVAIVGARLDITHSADGAVRIGGFERLSRRATNGASGRPSLWSWLAVLGRLSLIDADITWRDARNPEAPLRFRQADLSARIVDDELRLAGAMALPATLGRSLRFVAHVVGDLGAPRGWEGRFYLKGEDILAQAWLPALGFAYQGIESGVVQAELWGDWESARLHALQGTLDARELAVDVPGDARYVFGQVGADLRWVYEAPGWRLDVANLALQRQTNRWPLSGFNLAATRAESGDWTLHGGFDYLDIDDVREVLLTSRHLPPRVREVLEQLRPRGRLYGLRIDSVVQAGKLDGLALTTAFANLGVGALGRAPALAGVDGQVRFDLSQGELTLTTRQASVEFARLFRTPLTIAQADGTVRWRREAAEWVIDGESVSVANADLNAKGRIGVRLPVAGGAPTLDLDIAFADGVVAHTGRYLPVGIMPAATVAWLDSALVGGRVLGGRALYQGRTDLFPFRNGEGRFETRFEVDDVELAYHQEWPALQAVDAEVVFNGPGMHIAARGGKLYDTQLQDTAARIDDLKQALLVIEGRTQGPTQDIVQFLRDSPLGKAFAPTLAALTATGDAPLRLALQLDLRKGGQPPQVDGDVRLDGSTLAFADWGLHFEQLQGTLGFTQDGLAAEKIEARLFDQPAQLRVVRDAKGNRFELTGRAETPALARAWPHAVWKRVSGGSDLTASLTVPPARTGGKPVLRVGSSLQGVAIDLPAPLGKSAQGTRALLAEWSPDAERGMRLSVRNGEALDALLAFSVTDGAYGFAQGEVRVGGTPAQWPSQPGLRLAGTLAVCAADEWQSLGGDAAADKADSFIGLPVWITGLDFSCGEWHTGGQTLRGVQLLGTRDEQEWTFQLASEEAAGLISVPHVIDSERPLRAQLERLSLGAATKDAAPAPAQAPTQDPRRVPPLQVTVRQFSYQGQPFGTLEMESQPKEDGMHIERFSLNDEALQVNASGDWWLLEGAHNSRFNLDIQGPRLGAILGKFGFRGGIKEGKTKASLLATWPDAPARFALAKLDGRMRIDIKNGSFTELEPGAGRVFGLFNLDEVQRRLRLDFTDLFGKGFSFDSIEGDVTFSNGNAYTNNLTVVGPPARLDISGRTGLAARDYDQVITVTPSVSGSLPVAGAIAHPGIGAALFVAQKLFQSQIESMTRYQYIVRGSWDKPDITRVEKPLLERLEEPVKDMLKK